MSCLTANVDFLGRAARAGSPSPAQCVLDWLVAAQHELCLPGSEPQFEILNGNKSLVAANAPDPIALLYSLLPLHLALLTRLEESWSNIYHRRLEACKTIGERLCIPAQGLQV